MREGGVSPSPWNPGAQPGCGVPWGGVDPSPWNPRAQPGCGVPPRGKTEARARLGVFVGWGVHPVYPHRAKGGETEARGGLDPSPGEGS